MKIKVTSLDIVVGLIDGKPYYSLKYKELGNDYYNVGYSSYSLENVIAWRNECFDMVQANGDGDWIPVSEKMPEERDWYLAVFRETDTGYQLIPRVADFMNMPEKENTTSDGWNIIDLEKPKEYIKLLKCVAWMPLPEPYKEN